MKHYNTLLVILIILFCGTHTNAQQAEVLDNKKLVELTNAKVGDDLLISFIKSSPVNFNCGMNEILALKNQNVSEKVLVEVAKICNVEKTKKEDSINSNNPAYFHNPGVYVLDNENSSTVLEKLYPTVISNERGGGIGQSFASRFTYGAAKSSKIVQINGPDAKIKAREDAVFYFYFETTEKPSMANWWFSKATSPNEFTLVKLQVKKNNREFKKGKSDSYSYATGIDDDQKIQFDFEEVKPGIFKVMAKTTLKEGEYCFIYSSAVPSQYSNDKVFDFSIKNQ